MAKKTTKETVSKKPLKKVKSFNLDDRIYNGLMEILETSGTKINLSALIDEFLRKLYVYLLEAEGVIKKGNSNLPLSRVVYDCMDIEYFRESNKKNTRVWNLIWAHQASKEGMSLAAWMAQFPPEEFEDVN